MAIIQDRSKINKKLSKKVRMPVTEQYSTIKIARFNEKILQKKIQFPKGKKKIVLESSSLFLAA